MIVPVQKDERFLADVAAARHARDRLHVWWLGQSGFLVQFAGSHLLFDPYLSDSLTRKYAATDKPHTRMTERVVDPGALSFVDVVTSSHNHTDHLDAETLGPILRANPEAKLVIPEANRAFVTQRLGIPPDAPLGLDAGQSITLGEFTVHAVPAAHEGLDRDPQGRFSYLGYVVRCGGWTLYHSGDTVLYEGMVESLRRWAIDLAFLPINGRAPERRVAGNLDGPEAAQLAYHAGMGVVIPCHYEMFAFNTASPEQFVATCQTLGQRYAVLRAGERWSSRLGSSH